jgi:hypothetical protein
VGEVGEARLQPSDDVTEADWIRERLVGFGAGVYSLVPSGFPAYVRVFHPAYRGGYEKRLVRWAEVAERAGTTMHALAQFHFLNQPLGDAASISEAWEVGGPDAGNLEPELLRVLCEVLGRHTATPSACWFCLWDGYGSLHPGGHSFYISARPDDATWEGALREAPPAPVETPTPPRPLVELPYREYLLFSGPVQAALEMGERSRGVFFPQSPNLFWPTDHAWCVATEIDLDSTYIGGSQALADALLADPRLETRRVDANDPISRDSDTLNQQRR